MNPRSMCLDHNYLTIHMLFMLLDQLGIHDTNGPILLTQLISERVMIERREKDILIMSDDDRKKISISKSTKIN